MSDCKKALQETGADMEKAIEYLRKKGMAAAAKKATRIASQGTIANYLHGSRIGVMVEVNCETDFVARNEAFVEFAKDVAMQIAAMSPLYVSEEDVDAGAVEKERAIRMAVARESGKPEKMLEKIVDGQISKWKKEICLVDQAWVKDNDKTIGSLTQELIAKLGENIRVRRFVRFELGEGLEKKQDDFAAEVAKQAGLA